MDLMESFRTLRRRWILTSVLIVLTLAGTAAAFVKLPWTYQAQAMTVFISSKNAAKSAGDNPYLSFNDSLTLTADVVRREILDPRTALDLKNRGFPSSYLVVAAPDTAGPVLLITATGSNSAQVESTLRAVTSEVGTKLLALQSGISANNQIRDLVVYQTPKATRSTSKKARPLAALLAIGVMLTFSIPQIVDAWASRRRSPREARQERDRRRVPSQRPAARHYIADRLPSNDRAGDVTHSRAQPPRADAERSVRYGGGLEPDDPEPFFRNRLR